MRDKLEKWFRQAVGAQQAGRLEAAERDYRRILKLEKGHVPTLMNLGLVLRRRGRFAQAARCFHEVIRLRPATPMAYFHLAHMRVHDFSDRELEVMARLFARSDVPANERVFLGFAMASVFDRKGNAEQAMAWWGRVHGLARQAGAVFDAGAYEQHIEGLIHAFTPELLGRAAPTAVPGRRPIFVVGMPRSGTTLTEQILASHPQVAGGGEIIALEEIVRELGQSTGRPLAENVLHLGEARLEALAARYLDKLPAHVAEAACFTDTTPMNFRLVGLIALLFPQAPIVHCSRDPLDNCLSIYQQPLSDSHAYAHDWGDLGRVYVLYRRLMAHWEQVLPGRIHRLCYERLVADPDGEIAALLDFCGLPFDPACLRFHETEREINTPSDTQVRKPLSAASIGKWKRYAPMLGELRDILEAHGVTRPEA
ncbi:tetratricopeptide repeat-containing sulfotransferase family protein [Thiohalobacter sp.]|uniref:tetratricopeptide repeat-containing sulfotransferase family protein n=1 Tax=Thiohalobacter sp. TaxID=2025948 RepID=UPI002608EAFA|nr:tetratricopeptide repeat-containing sulfotransferase family protein [Thiohalobacter sp.]